ncbi:MAG: DUF6531 domain-containing protein, partial [Thermoplasmata archaeon]
MSEKSDFKDKGASSRKLTKKKVLKITSVAVVALMVLVSFHQIRLNMSAVASDDPPEYEPRANAGYEDFYSYTGGMVNTANGNLYFTQKDISIKGRGFNIEIIRTFNSQERTNAYQQDWFGLGWTCNYFVYVQEIDGTGNVTLTEGDGSVHEYGYTDVDGYYLTPPGKHGRLEKNEIGTFVLRFLDGSVYNFNPQGKLYNITDKNGNKLSFTYSLFGELIKIEDDSGMYLNLSYNGDKISNITDSMGRKITYTYFDNTITNVTDATGNYTLYSHLTIEPDPIALLTSVINKVGWRLNFSYVYNSSTDTYRVKDVYNSMWNYSSSSSYNSFRMYDFTYYDYKSSDPLNDIYCRTNITDARGYTTRVYMNDYGNPLKIEDPTANATVTKWDFDFNKISYTDAKSNNYTYSYSTY